jgi:hypothetical protein
MGASPPTNQVRERRGPPLFATGAITGIATGEGGRRRLEIEEGKSEAHEQSGAGIRGGIPPGRSKGEEIDGANGTRGREAKDA